MLELYIFNKESPAKNGLTSFIENHSEDIKASLVFNLDRFRLKDKNDHLLTEFAQEITFLYKETESLRPLFEKFSGQSINISLVDNYHHILCYDPVKEELIIDSKIEFKFCPIYLFAVYYSLARKSETEQEIYTIMHEFFMHFDFRAIKSIIDLLSFDKEHSRQYDAGGHLLEYFRGLETARSQSLSLKKGYLLTQLLRNRALAGRLPFDLQAFQSISEHYHEDAFSGQAIEDYFQSFKTSFDKDFAKIYYQHLCYSLNHIGLRVVAQRGSRVAHEQGPILANSGTLNTNSEFEIKVKKTRSSILELILKIEEQIFQHKTSFVTRSLSRFANQDIDSLVLKIDSNLDAILYLAQKENFPKARFEKYLLLITSSLNELFAFIQKDIFNKKNKSDKIWTNYESLKSIEKQSLTMVYDLSQALASLPFHHQKAVIYVQRPSSRSGHFIPRILMGQNLYIETDFESEQQRINAIAFNFVVPDLEYIAGGIDSFFENASISIVTDRDSGKPEIKWENAEDLAITLAPAMYRAIKAAQEQSRKFHYQLETTLVGPLIDLFLALLENEISIVASVDRYCSLSNLPSAQQKDDIDYVPAEIKEILSAYETDLIEAADYVFAYYLLDDYLQDFMLSEGLSKVEAIREISLTLRDVQKDIAAYCLIKKQNNLNSLFAFKNELENLKLPAKEYAEKISGFLIEQVSKLEVKKFVKNYLRYPLSTARKEFLASKPEMNRLLVSSNKNINNSDFVFNFSVAPSRIDFGKHVVASITTLMGRILGANDNESLDAAKQYIDLVSLHGNSLFETASEAGSVKVIENTCRALQYAKAISFQGVFQDFAIDGMQARMTVNSRNTKAAGVHLMEFGTMASTGYCITKEPLFILLGLSLTTDDILQKLGVENPADRNELKDFFVELLAARDKFASHLEWQAYFYEELVLNNNVQKYLADKKFKWLPNIETMTHLLKYVADYSTNSKITRVYNQLAAKLIEFGRIINETGIIQRIELMNQAVNISQQKSKHSKSYKDIKIALNAAYKGNVSDERENANQYLMAFLLHQKQYLKNSSNPDIAELIDYQIQNYDLPAEIRVFDPLVDKDVFMGAELKARAEQCLSKLTLLDFEPALTKDIIEACVISYGSNPDDWRVLSKRKCITAKAELENLRADIKLLEIYVKGFFKNPKEAFQGVDVIQLNADHDLLKDQMENLVELKNLMKINNNNSLLILLDNPQQAKKPFFDFDKSLEWMNLGGTIVSHMIAPEVYSRWMQDSNAESTWAKLFMQKLIYESNTSKEILATLNDYKQIIGDVNQSFADLQKFIDIKRDLVEQKFLEAIDMSASLKSLNRYNEIIMCYSRVAAYKSINELDFKDWLILGGRWILNGQKQSDIEYVVSLFEKGEDSAKLGKRGHELLRLFVSAQAEIVIDKHERLIEKAGSTKEGDLLVTSAGDSLEFRAIEALKSQATSVRLLEIENYKSRISQDLAFDELESMFDSQAAEYIEYYKADKSNLAELNKKSARLLVIFEKQYKAIAICNRSWDKLVADFMRVKNSEQLTLVEFLGDHKSSGGLFRELTTEAVKKTDSENLLAKLAEFAESFIFIYLIYLTINIKDENEMINKLAVFFDQYLNIHEEDYPPYAFHSLCAGGSYGFNQTYYLDTNLKVKMFKLSCKTGINIYKLAYYLISNKTVLSRTSQEYKDSLIGDYENGIIPICYQHETICIEERLWDCMRALRNFVRNYHDRHPLPIIIKAEDASVDNLFRYKLDDTVKLCFIAALASPGKHSWDLNCVFRSPYLRERILETDNSSFVTISIFTPFLTSEGEIKQIYTSFDPILIEEQKINYLAPFSQIDSNCVEGHKGSYQLNSEGFVHAVVLLADEQLPKPQITMSAHTHQQYLNNMTLELGVPEVWSMLNMQQMYAKTELAKILSEVNLPYLAQIEFMQKSYNSKDEVIRDFDAKLAAADLEHIDSWILKASRDSGGRGISTRLNLTKDRQKIIDFIWSKIKSDDVVMQEFVPNNARAFINNDFLHKIEDAFINDGLAISEITPQIDLYFAMRSFQSMSGIKGYLFSVNAGNVTVNAGQGAKMFYGEPLCLMSIYLAAKLQKLMDEFGELIIKQAIPAHAKKFAQANNLKITDSNIYMLNGLFDYIPYLFVKRPAKSGQEKEFKIHCINNFQGGLDFYYNYYGQNVKLLSKTNHKDSVLAIEQLLKDFANGDYNGPETALDIGLAVVELNSGLGQANLLHKAVLDMAPSNVDVFLEWTEDLALIAMNSNVSVD